MFEGLRSTAKKLARVFRKSRDTWKRRATEKQRRLKAIVGTVRDLTRSRDQWKAKAKQLQEQLRLLETHSRSELLPTQPTLAAVSAGYGSGELTAPPFCPHHAAKASRSV
jgi:hypothetical protein